MPALPPVTDVIRYKLLWTDGAALDVSTVFYFQYGGGSPSSADCLSLATQVYNAAVSELIPNIGADWILVGCDAEDLNSASGAHATYTHSTPGGDATGQPLSAQVAVLINHVIGRRYRGGKPRSYLPGPTSAAINTPQEWSSAFQSAVTAAFGTFISDILAATAGTTLMLEHVNVSYYSGFTSVQDPTTLRWRNVAKRRVTPVVDNILSSACNLKIGTQRRRIGA